LCFETGTGAPLPSFAATGKIAFITTVSGNGNLGSWPDAGGASGIAAGDAICQARATAAGLANAANFRAWLSDSSMDAKDRYTSDGPWVRPDGVKVAEDMADLTDGSLFTAITQDESGGYRGNTGAWTGTGTDGILTANICADWTDGTNAINGTGGRSSFAGRGWSDMDTRTCDSTFEHLFCLED
jgi:hypothetical protein